MKNNIPTILLERYILNEVTDEERKLIETQSKTDKDLVNRIKYLQKANQIFSDQHPVKETILQIEKKLEVGKGKTTKQHSKFFLGYWPIYGLVAASFLGVFLLKPLILPEKRVTNSILQDNDINIKGDSGLYIFLKTKYLAKRLEDNSVVKPGDVIQIAYYVKKPLYGIIFSVDGNGFVTYHFPKAHDQDLKLNPISIHFLKDAFKLDNAPKFERFFLLTSTEKFDINEIAGKINDSKNNSLDAVKLRDILKKFDIQMINLIKE